jgi:hypothetical protein
MTSPFHQEKKITSSTKKHMFTSKLVPKKKPTETYNTSEEGPGKSDMIGMPGTEFRRKVDLEVKNYDLKNLKTKSPMKMITEKKTGEKYPSKVAKAKHEKTESKAEMKKEYGRVKSPMKQTTSKPMAKETMKKTPVKMKKC